MGVFDSLLTAVAGLQAQAYALQNISGNIANSSTVGYKSVETSFEALLSSSSASASASSAGSVAAISSSTNSVQGTISASTSGTNLAISGSGYFQVISGTAASSATYYTRQGDFSLNSTGNLVNTAGYSLTGLPIDSGTGAVSGSTAEVITIDTGAIPAVATTTVDYSANLPSDSSVAMLGDASDYAASSGFPGSIAADDSATFLDDSLSGGSVTIYDTGGNETDLTLRWAKTGDDTWSLYYQSESSASGSDAAWTKVGGTFTFDPSGALESATSLGVSDLTVDGTDFGSLTLSFADGLTQYASGTAVSETSITQDGAAVGVYSGVAISDGIVQATYSNGRTVSLYQVGVYAFSGESGLLAVSGNAYEATTASGSAMLSTSATIESSALESSNVDITDQFSKLIVTQQAYAANSKVMQTANTMMQTLLDVVR